jgi:hypothetical protein
MLATLSVQWVRWSAGFTSLKARLLAAGMLTGTQIAAQLGVRRTTIGRWRREGRLEARICNEMGQWLYAPGQPRPSDPSTPRATATLNPEDISRVGGQYERRSFALDVLACPHCGGRLRLIATLHDPAVIRKLLAHLGMARSGPSPGPAPPESAAAAS